MRPSTGKIYFRCENYRQTPREVSVVPETLLVRLVDRAILLTAGLLRYDQTFGRRMGEVGELRPTLLRSD